ncbi:hypothetical protein BN8_01420 [Fibrisoma limi BUZ 3]|uniref:Uncharacterized protein n=1 Tax=Fibrisoma limi BUZ 3 TaxID=1185876 RepID=I2GEU3_9BACT|nr:hypothetical protein BN8_01420 [Fibrisoma limi BUZ 3]
MSKNGQKSFGGGQLSEAVAKPGKIKSTTLLVMLSN